MCWLSLVIACAAVVAQPLRLEKAIPLAGVEGRIDHLSLDLAGQRLFVAALGNDTVEVIDLSKSARVATIKGLHEPQGVVYAGGKLFVANGKDGIVRVFDGKTFEPTQSLEFGDDADNLRFDAAAKRVLVGYGNGALGEFDLDGKRTGEIKLSAHPEAFQIETSGPRIFVNIPQSRDIAVVDRQSKKVVAHWGTGGPLANYPMAIDVSNERLFVVCRLPARLVVLNTADGKRIASVPTVGDCDDVFYDAPRKRIYAIGGEGQIAVLEQTDADHYREIARVPTVKGARTGYYSKDLDRLFVAVRKQGSNAAEIRVYIPGK